jgi:1,4-alpha-glucan branching enzyme
MKTNLKTFLSRYIVPPRLTQDPRYPVLTLGRLRPTRTAATSSKKHTTPPKALASPVRFEFCHPTARRVCVAGSFNDWNPSATPLVPLGGHKWLRMLWLPPGAYEYLFVADGVWYFDPLAKDYLPNVYGTLNAVIEVAASYLRANGKTVRGLSCLRHRDSSLRPTVAKTASRHL